MTNIVQNLTIGGKGVDGFEPGTASLVGTDKSTELF